jgi:hypothetical protein
MAFSNPRPEPITLTEATRAQLFFSNADHKGWTKHVASFSGPSAEVIALVEKIRNNSGH